MRDERIFQPSLRMPQWLGLMLCLFLTKEGLAVMRPQVINTTFPTGDIVIASLVVEAPHDGVGDATSVIQKAIDEAASAGGGVVFLPAGRYRLNGRLVLKEGVTLRGDWASPLHGGNGKGTVLMPTADRGNPDAPPAVTLERGSGLREMTVWYPEQNPSAIVPYPWTLRTSETVNGDNYTVQNVTLVNPYQAIKVGPEGNELHTLRNVYGTPLKTGIWIDTCSDIGRLIDVDFRARWWEESRLPGAPTTETAKKALRDFIGRESVGVDVGRSDWEYLYGVRVEGYGTGINMRQGVAGTTNAVMFGSELLDCGTALRLDRLNGIGLSATGCRFTGRDCDVHAPASFDATTQFNTCEFGGQPRQAVLLEGAGALTFQNCVFASGLATAVSARAGSVSLLGCDFKHTGSHVKLGERLKRARLLGNKFTGKPTIINEANLGDVQITHRSFKFARPDTSPHLAAPDPRPARRNFFVVTDFGAAPAEADNTSAFMRAFDAARKAGGGTVYVPAGNYRFSGELVAPKGVELRGCFDVPHHTISGGSVLMPTAGRGNAEGTPFIRLESGSGVRGLTIWYPGQNPGNVVPYPWSIRSMGPRCWLVDVTLGNAYQGVDFWTHPSDGHVIRYLAGAVFKKGLFVSKCAGDGWVEDVQFNPHYSMRLHPSLSREVSEGKDIGGVIDYQRANLEGIVFGRCEREHVRGTFLYAAYDGIAFRNDGGGANARVIEHGTDTASRGAVIEATGNKGVEFIDAQLVPYGVHEKGAIIVTDAFAGKVSFFNSQMWAGSVTGVIGGRGDVLIQQLNSLSGGVTINGSRCAIENAHFTRGLDPHVRIEPDCERANLISNISDSGLFRIANSGGEHCCARANSLSLRPAPGRHNFRTGWEEGEPQGLPDTVVTQGGGRRAVSKAECHPTNADAHTGKRALKVAGIADDPGYSFVYFKVFDEPLAVALDSILTYWIRPANERGRCVGIDLLFTDGSTLRDSGAATTDGQGVHPGTSKGTVGKWRQIGIPVGRFHQGKTIAAIMFAYDSRNGGGPFEALIDDLSLESTEASIASEVVASPRGGTAPVGTQVKLSSADGATIRYTLDGTPPQSDSPRYESPIVLDHPGLWDVRFAARTPEGKLSSSYESYDRVYGELYDVK